VVPAGHETKESCTSIYLQIYQQKVYAPKIFISVYFSARKQGTYEDKVEPGYYNIGLCDISCIVSDILR
jgi:hypothetical protein